MGRPRSEYCKRGHARTPDNVMSNRHCRECHNATRRTQPRRPRAPRAPGRPPAQRRAPLDLPGLEIIADYQHGDTLREIAAKHGCDPTTIGNRLRAWAIPLRTGGGVKGRPNLALTKTLPLDIIDAYKDGQSLRQIAAVFSVDKATVGKRLREVGVALRPARRPRQVTQ